MSSAIIYYIDIDIDIDIDILKDKETNTKIQERKAISFAMLTD
jgi:hypothetical protein